MFHTKTVTGNRKFVTGKTLNTVQSIDLSPEDPSVALQ
jgi:hypothetical protein